MHTPGRLWSLVLAAALPACGGGDGDPIDAPPGSPDGPRVIDAVIADARIPMFDTAITLSEPANASFLPAIAERAGTVVVAWHDFPAGGVPPSRVVTVAIVDGVPGPIEPVPEILQAPKRPALAVTTTGFVLAYEATDPDAGITVIRSIDLDADGHALGEPLTISGPGALGTVPRIASSGDDVAYAWTDGSAHHVALRGTETLPATPVGTTLQSTGILNFPRVALTSTGTLLVAYRDGGAAPEDWDVLLVTRPRRGSFAAPVNVSRSTGLLSDDIALAIEPDDTLDLVWVDQDPIDVNAFEVDHATRDPGGTLSTPARFGIQGLWSWTPSVTSGNHAVWHTGGGAGGDLWLASAGGAPMPILAGEQGAMVALAREPSTGVLHLAYVTPGTPRQIRYARSD